MNFSEMKMDVTGVKWERGGLCGLILIWGKMKHGKITQKIWRYRDENKKSFSNLSYPCNGHITGRTTIGF